MEECCQCGSVANANVANSQLVLVIGIDNIGNTGNILQPYLMITVSPEDLAI